MPTSVWTCQVSFDAFAYTPPPATWDPLLPGNRYEWLIGFEVIALPLLDTLPAFNAPIDQGNFFFGVGINSFGTAFQVVEARLGDSEIKPTFYHAPFIISPSPFLLGGAPALLTAGGTLTITKDYDGDLLTFAGPLGTQTVALSDFATLPTPPADSYHNTTPLRPRGLVAEMILADPIGSFPSFPVDHSVKFYDLIGKENGVAYQTIALSVADPGTWWPAYYLSFDPSFGVTGSVSTPYWTYSQEATRAKLRAQATVAPGPFGFDEYPFVWRFFDTWRRLMVAVDSAMDMTTAWEHGPLFAALVYSTAPGVVRFRRTYDTGTSWTETDLYSNAATSNTSPTILWHQGRLYGVWQRDSAIVQSVSPDLGVSWGTPVTLAISGTNPRALVDPRHGLSFYFYVDAGDLKLRRSANFGTDWIDASPLTVATSVGAQTVAAEIAADGSLLVSYIASGAWTQVRSKDLGVSWA